MKRIAIYSIIVASAIVVGTTTGVLVKRYAVSAELDYGDLDVNSMKPDSEEIYKKVSSYKGNKEIVDVFSTSDVMNYAFEKYRRYENSYSFLLGLADTIVKQDVRSAQIRNGNSYFEESVSKSSMISLGNRMYQTGTEGTIDMYTGNSKSVQMLEDGCSVEYTNTTPKTYENDVYSNTFGKTLDEVFIYLVSDKTILKSETNKIENGYSIYLELDPVLAPYFYKLQMKNISNLDKLPVFSEVKLTFTLDKNLDLKHCTVSEDYVATMMVDAKTHGSLEYYYYPNEYMKIPELNESLTYRKGE